MFTAWKAVVIRNMALKAVVLVLFVCFVDLTSATYCTYDGSLSSDECYGYLESCCSDGVCRERCYVCSYDSQCGTGECCNSNSECATYCSTSGSIVTYINGGAVAGVVIGCLVIVAIIASIVACCCCACCPYYRHRHPGTVLVAQPGYQPTVSTTTTQLQTIQHPPPSGYNPPNAGFYPPPPPGGYSQPPPQYYPQPQAGPYPPPQAPGPALYPPPQAQGPYPQYPASTGQPIKQKKVKNYSAKLMMPTISEEEVALVTDEWKVYKAGDVDADSTTHRVDHYWADVFQEKSQQGEFKYSVLQKLVKSLLSLAHDNADVERSLSANKKTVTPDRASLGDLTINGLRSVKDHVKKCGEPQNVQITKGLLQASREAHKAHAKRLSDEKEELAKKKSIQDAEKQRLRDAEKEREREAEKLERSRMNLSEREKELMKSEGQKDSELQTAKTLYEEANERLSQAIKNKNFNEAAIAQGLLEVAKKKMEHAMEQTKRCSNKRTELDKNKKRLLEGYSKHVSAKKRKDTH